MLTYRDSDHAYFYNGRQVPGITRVLSDLGCYNGSAFYTENSRQRGQAVHSACQLADIHCPEAETLDDLWDTLEVAPDIWPYLEGYLRFRREKRFKQASWEQALYSSKLRVAGRPDTHGRMVFIDGPRCVVDLKSWASQGANPKHSAEIQTAAYAIMLAEQWGCDPLSIERYVVKLPGDGNYRCYHCDNADDFREAQYAVTLWWKWQEKKIFKFTGDPDEVLTIGE